MAIQLTEGSIVSIMEGHPIEPPILQVLGIRKLPHPGASDRYRLMLSDGIRCVNFAMLATQQNVKIENGELVDNAIIRLKHHITSKLNKEKSDRRVLIILDIEVILPGSEIEKIGNPLLYAEDTPTTQQPATNENMRPNVQQPPAKMPRMERAMHGSGSSEQIVTRPISSINPYQNKWTIRARVTAKPPIRTWSNSRGEGCLFSMDLKDETGEIRATAFKEDCDRFYNMIEVDKVYYISNCTVKNANKKFSQIKNDFEITFTRDTTVVPVEDEVVTIPGLEYNFQPIASLADVAVESLVDVIGVCKSFGDCNTLVARSTGKELKKREITLVDNSNASINLTLWAEKAEQFDGTDHPVIAVRTARITEFQGSKSLGTTMSSNFMVNPDLPEAHRLKGWFDNGGANEAVVSISAGGAGSGNNQGITGDIISIMDSKDSQLGFGEAPDFYNTVVSIMSVKRDNVYYLACPSADCKKKVIDNHNGSYRCEKCARDYEDCLPRMIIQMNVADWSDNVWVTLFDNDAQTLLQVDGRELKQRKEENEEQFNEVFDKVKFAQLKVRMRVKAEMYNDESRLRTVVAKLEVLDVKENNQRLLREIYTMKSQGVKSGY